MLRGLAAVMVVIHHARNSVEGGQAWPSFGASGVDIFFVISGYVMMLTTQGPISPLQFLLKRVARIVPLYWLAIIWEARRGPIDADVLKDAFFIPHFNNAIPDWIAPSVQQGWTLNYEMVFYLIFTLSMTFSKKRSYFVLVLLAIMPSLAVLPGVVFEFYGNSIVYEFGFGVLLFLWVSWCPPQGSQLVNLCIMILGFVILASASGVWPRAMTQGLPAMLIVWASFLACRGWLKFRIVTVLGNASYAIYLFHWASFGLMTPVGRVVHNPHVLMLGYITTAVVTGVIIHLVVERPLTNKISQWLRLRKIAEEKAVF
jgi:exopolysaccharide production protein ExoZ